MCSGFSVMVAVVVALMSTLVVVDLHIIITPLPPCDIQF
jgi:hypothetical protein